MSVYPQAYLCGADGGGRQYLYFRTGLYFYPQDYLCGADGGERQYLYFCTSKASKLSTSGEACNNSLQLIVQPIDC